MVFATSWRAPGGRTFPYSLGRRRSPQPLLFFAWVRLFGCYGSVRLYFKADGAAFCFPKRECLHRHVSVCIGKHANEVEYIVYVLLPFFNFVSQSYIVGD